jgi:hypothetical protein
VPGRVGASGACPGPNAVRPDTTVACQRLGAFGNRYGQFIHGGPQITQITQIQQEEKGPKQQT